MGENSEGKKMARLFAAVCEGRADLVQKYIAAGDSPHVAETESGASVTALHMSASKGYTYIADQLIKAGADINSTDDNGFTAVHWSAFQGQAGTISYLLSIGADVHAHDKLMPV